MEQGGVNLPLIISNNVKVKGLRRGCIKINSQKRPGLIKFGFGGSEGVCANKNGYIIFGKFGILKVEGKTSFSSGSTLRIDNGECIIGENFSCNKNCCIFCSKQIEFGKDALLGWNVFVRDGDGHNISENGQENSSSKSVKIGDHVWIASFVDILKGVTTGNDCVIACRSCATKSIEGNGVLIAGVPAKIIKRNISWHI